MADSPRPLPFVQVAALCERVLLEHDNVPSAIRIVDTFNVDVVQMAADALGGSAVDLSTLPHVPGPPILPVQATLLLSMKSSSGQQEHFDAEIHSYNTEGELKSSAPFSFDVGPAERGAMLVLNLHLMAEQEGLHHLDVLVDGRLLTRIPYRVNLVTTEQAGRVGQPTPPA
jgi:hypothetical protein